MENIRKVTDMTVQRIAIVSVHACPLDSPGSNSAGGMSVYLRNMIPMLAEAGVCVDLFTRSHQTGHQEVENLGPRGRIIHIDAGPLSPDWDGMADFLDRFLNRVTSFIDGDGSGYDLIHSHYWLSGFVGRALSRHLGVPHAVTFHTLALLKESSGGKLERQERKSAEIDMINSADQIFALTSHEADFLSDVYEVEGTRIHIVPGGVDSSVFQQRDRLLARTRLGLDPGELIVLYVGRLESFKGPEILVQSLAAGMRDSRVRVLFVGGDQLGLESAELRRLADKLRVGDQVSFQSAVRHDLLPEYYSAADVCAVPSFHETFGLVALEAMACGLPVVATDVGALRLLVTHGETGLLVPKPDPVLFSESLVYLLGDDRLRSSMGQAARDRSHDFPWAITASTALEGYERMVSGLSSRPHVFPCLG